MRLKSSTLRTLSAIIFTLSTLAGAELLSKRGALVRSEAEVEPSVVAMSNLATAMFADIGANVAPALAGEARKCASAFGPYEAVCVSALGPIPCDIDGRLKGVRIGSELFRRTMASFPESLCSVAGANG